MRAGTAGTATKYKGCGQEQQMAEGWRKGLRGSKGDLGGRETDDGGHCGSRAPTRTCIEHRESDVVQQDLRHRCLDTPVCIPKEQHMHAV